MDVVVSKGQAPIVVPSLRGVPLAVAQQALTQLGLRADVSRRTDADVPADTVIEQSPSANDRVGPGATIKLVVSSGPKLITVPDVRGRRIADAADALTSAGFQVEPVGPQALGVAAGTNPGAGTQLPEGTRIQLLVP